MHFSLQINLRDDRYGSTNPRMQPIDSLQYMLYNALFPACINSVTQATLRTAQAYD